MSNGEIGDKTILKDMYDAIAVRLARNKDFVISEAITKHLGHEDWTFDEVISRLSSRSIGEKEVWVMDEISIAEFMPADVSLQDGFIGAKINYRILV